MSSNLPPGITEGMLPGNRPEDAAREHVEDWALDWLIDYDNDEVRRIILIGSAAITAEREEIKKLIDERIKESKLCGNQDTEADGFVFCGKCGQKRSV